MSSDMLTCQVVSKGRSMCTLQTNLSEVAELVVEQSRLLRLKDVLKHLIYLDQSLLSSAGESTIGKPPDGAYRSHNCLAWDCPGAHECSLPVCVQNRATTTIYIVATSGEFRRRVSNGGHAYR